MPQVFKIGPYWVYFWTNENKPLEPIHVHVFRKKSCFQWHKDMDYCFWKMSFVSQ